MDLTSRNWARKLRTEFPQLCNLRFQYEDIYQLDFLFSLRIKLIRIKLSALSLPSQEQRKFNTSPLPSHLLNGNSLAIWFVFTISMIIEDGVLTVSLSQELCGCLLFQGHPLQRLEHTFPKAKWYGVLTQQPLEKGWLQEQGLSLGIPWGVLQKGNISNQLNKVLTPFTTHRTPVSMIKNNKVTGGTKLTAEFGCIRELTLPALRLAAVGRKNTILLNH